MHLHGLIQSAHLEENPPGSDTIELILKVQGVGPSQPRTLVIPFELLVQDENLDADTIARRAFDAEVEQAADGRWVVNAIAFASRVLREPE